MNNHLTTYPSVKITEYPTAMLLQINEPPIVFQRPITTDTLFQDLTMMTFQELIKKSAKAALRAKSLNVFTNSVSVVITITSLKALQSIALELTLKAIFDGLNKFVIQNDSQITHAQVWFKKATTRYPKPIVEVELQDVITGDNIYFRLESPCIEKVNPVVYNIGGKIEYDPQFMNRMTILEQSIAAQNYTSKNRYEICHMLFYVSDFSKDIDNMFLAYIGTLRINGYLDISSNIGIGMYKRPADVGKERTLINLVAK